MAGNDLPIHFFTLVLNGEPFIRYHLERFKALKCDWHWHIVEGLADLKHDTAWSLQFGASVPADVAKDGRSVDGTAEYLDEIANENPGRVTIYRAPNGRKWDGKLEMVKAPMANLPKECLLWEVDSDELWTTEQLEKMRALFLQHPERTAAVFYCWYFVGPNLAINRHRRYQEIEWRRVWRFRSGMRWVAHEPPILAEPIGGGRGADVAMQRPFTPQEMESQGLVFQHFAYVVEPQLQFKEKYYGYKGITEQWRRLQAHDNFPAALKTFFNWPWVDAGAVVDPLDYCYIVPLAHIEDGKWVMGPPVAPWKRVPAEDQAIEEGRYQPGWKMGYHLLAGVINTFGLKVGAEIGVALAGHAEAILKRTKVERLYGVDSYRHRPEYDDPMNQPQEGMDRLYDNVSRYVKKFGERFVFLRMDSQEAAGHITEPLDFVYIDADHSYEGAKRDLETWYPKVRAGGIVSGHDYLAANFPGVQRAVDEFLAAQGLRANAGPYQFWWVQKHAEGAVAGGGAIPAAAGGFAGGTTSGPAKRGILYVTWGATQPVLQRSLASVRAVHPELPVHVHRLPDDATLLDKASLQRFTPFEETLFLDVDTVVLDRLDFGFEMAERHGLACCICENPWARRYGEGKGVLRGDMVEYNTGVLFFTKKATPIFERWEGVVRTVNSSIRFYNAQKQLVVMPYNDQAGFAQAVNEAAVPPFILPFNWNFRPAWHRAWWGPIKVWHDYSEPPRDVVAFSMAQAKADAIIQFVKFNAP